MEWPQRELRTLLQYDLTAIARGRQRANVGCVRSMANSAIGALKYIAAQEGRRQFSVRAWMSEGTAREPSPGGGVLFIPYKAGEIAALRSMISAWMRIAIFEAMSRRGRSATMVRRGRARCAGSD